MYTKKELIIDERLDEILNEVYNMKLFTNLKLNYVEIRAFYTEDIYGDDNFDIRESTPVEAHFVECDVIIYINSEYNGKWRDVELKSVLAHILRLVDVSWSGDQPKINIDVKRKNVVDYEVMELFGDNNPFYSELIHKAQDLGEVPEQDDWFPRN